MLNKVVLMGRLVADPELRRTQSNTAVTSFRLAVDRTFARQGEQKQTDFIDIVAWQNTAEFVSRWFRKGTMAVVVGRLQTRKWTDRNGQNRVSVEVVAEEVYFGESKRSADGAQPSGRDDSDLPFEMPEEEDQFIELDDDDDKLPF
jgi:single-strand DNA-binding protein